tara:strand:+ start:139 stop:783 length:645 start_codon:yes stop_codon:yes gene_type:complete
MDLIKELIRNEILFQILILSFMGLTILLSHSFFYKYLLNKNFIFTSLMLPPLVLAVTKVISTNLYLSLGMIGALSIVRYRTPVKSQYELALYFAFICLGIIGGVNFYILLKLFLFLLFLPLLFFFLKKVIPNIFLDNINLTVTSQNNRVDIIIKSIDANEFIKKFSLQNNLVKLEINNDLKESYLVLNFESFEKVSNVTNEIMKDSRVKSLNMG